MAENMHHVAIEVGGSLTHIYFESEEPLAAEDAGPFTKAMYEVTALKLGHQSLINGYIECLASDDHDLKNNIPTNIQLIAEELRMYSDSNDSPNNPTEELLKDVPPKHRLEYRPEISRTDKLAGLFYQLGREVTERLFPNIL